MVCCQPANDVALFTMSRYCLRSVFVKEVALVALVVGSIISGIRFNIGGNGFICSRPLVLKALSR